jgi:hypothetical protein
LFSGLTVAQELEKWNQKKLWCWINGIQLQYLDIDGTHGWYWTKETECRDDQRLASTNLCNTNSSLTLIHFQGLFSRITFREPVFIGGTGNITGLAKKLPTTDGMIGCVRKFIANEHEYSYDILPFGDVTQGFDIREYHDILFYFTKINHDFIVIHFFFFYKINM